MLSEIIFTTTSLNLNFNPTYRFDREMFGAQNIERDILLYVLWFGTLHTSLKRCTEPSMRKCDFPLISSLTQHYFTQNYMYR